MTTARRAARTAAALGAGCVVAGTACTSAATQPGWQVTVYYTAVESYHPPAPAVDVTGCPVLDCSGGAEPLGRYPKAFVDAVRDEGTGRITSGPHTGGFLNWSASEGYWLDTAPRDGAGRPLLPYRSAAADDLADGTVVILRDCGHNPDATPRVCDALKAARWEVRDAFEPGYGGKRHIDLYIGEEDRSDFTRSEWYTTLDDATLELTHVPR